MTGNERPYICQLYIYINIYIYVAVSGTRCSYSSYLYNHEEELIYKNKLMFTDIQEWESTKDVCTGGVKNISVHSITLN